MKISTQEMVMAAMFTAMMCVISILVRVFQPIIMIPFSLQPLVMLLAAYLLSPRAAFLSMLAYLLLGIVGFPVFSVPPYGGPAYILIPTFGFILGFPAAAWVQSKLIKPIPRPSFISAGARGGLAYYLKSLPSFIPAGVGGVLIYYLIGLPYMYLILNFYLGHNVDIIQVLKLGFIPFIAMDLVKVIAASFLAVELCRRFHIKREI